MPISLTAFMAPHVAALRRTFAVTLVASGESEAVSALLHEGVSFTSVPIARNISIVADVRALFRLWALFRRERFDLVQSITPKAGLLAMVAARLAGVPVRVHWFTGQVWATRTGWSRVLLKTMDRILVRNATHLLADSPSQVEFMTAQGIVRRGQVDILGSGSVCGVDTARFTPNPETADQIRIAVGIPTNGVVMLYLGRFNREKGVVELAAAFGRAAQACSNLFLLMVGPDEAGLRPLLLEKAGGAADRVRFVDYTASPEQYMAAADVFVLPSHREGFGSTVIEAAACQVPAIATRIYGLTDAVADEESGLLVPVGDVPALERAMVRLAADEPRRRAMGRVGRLRVERSFRQDRLTGALVALYDQLLGSPRPV